MDEFAADLKELDETQERVEAVSDGMLRALKAGDEPLVRAMVARWVQALRASDFQAERVAFLFVANHVLHKADGALFRELFGEHMAEAVALVCNSPMDRHNVTKLLELWHEKAVRHIVILSFCHFFRMWGFLGDDMTNFFLLLYVCRDDRSSRTCRSWSCGSARARSCRHFCRRWRARRRRMGRRWMLLWTTVARITTCNCRTRSP